mmetsp:Transcript_48001/g.55318  ORF Transcript_48001/g.55318 Transcript_48001/m.55318 type:complete len:122 (-) Transcript_48001:222-587(-)|eukprot:CAMPEP_0115011234 /NCGR_PEP_ID=MMETSP0216-20121206/23849_1 /TAXON_ID=223996 /ORGANISM="Protocruzia adherens, Strain Boccale" /LENGTH=121 /DNA_ID=CAMNT_0002379719 /DNA_START=40 /DNA_END=405 /DNA_ORIENTATION=-
MKWQKFFLIALIFLFAHVQVLQSKSFLGKKRASTFQEQSLDVSEQLTETAGPKKYASGNNNNNTPVNPRVAMMAKKTKKKIGDPTESPGAPVNTQVFDEEAEAYRKNNHNHGGNGGGSGVV